MLPFKDWKYNEDDMTYTDPHKNKWTYRVKATELSFLNFDKKSCLYSQQTELASFFMITINANG